MKLPLAHGESIIEWQGDILTIRAYDAFNREGIVKSKQQLIATVNDRVALSPQKPWGRLAVIDDNALPTFDSCDLIFESFDWVQQRGCVAAAIVSNHNPLYKQMFSNIAINMSFFDYEQEARDWLVLQIEHASSHFPTKTTFKSLY